MPHIEVIGACPLATLHARLAPRTLREEEEVLRVLGCYLASDSNSLLLDCMTVEGYLRQSFFVLLTARPEAVMVRLLPRTSPEKTAGVKRLVAWIGSCVRAASSGATFGVTNLDDALRRPFPPESLSP